MLQATENKYTLETLKPLNVLYDHHHFLTQKDVEMVNRHVKLIERTRSESRPQIGDRLIYVDRYGTYYGNALIEKRDVESGQISICENPYIPFIWPSPGGIGLSVSGGAFHHLDSSQLKFIKWTEGSFKDWGHDGACANGAICFTARVPLWSYSEPDPLYGDFTTQTFRCFNLRKQTDDTAPNLYQGYDIAFRDESDLRQFIDDYEGTIFHHDNNRIVIWCFRREYRFLSPAEWEAVDAPVVERRLNAYPEQVKIVKDMEQHITIFHRLKSFTNR